MLKALTRAGLASLGWGYVLHRTARVIHNPLTVWATGSLAEPTLVRTRSGRRIYVIANEIVGRQIYITHTWDPHLLRVLQLLARGRSLLVDIGANIGFFSIELAAVAPEAEVHAVEPQEDLANLIERSAAASGLRGRIRVHRFGLSTEDGELPMSIDPANRGRSRLAVIDSLPSRLVRLRSTGDFLDEIAGDRTIDLIKLDVEGHESLVIGGMEKRLERQAVRAIVFESRRGDESDATTRMIAGHGYTILTIEKGLLAPVIRELGRVDQAHDYEDLLAVRPADLDQTRRLLARYLRT